MLEDVEIFKDYLVLEERIEGLVNLRIKPWDESITQSIIWTLGSQLMSPIRVQIPSLIHRVLRYGYTSLTTPNSTFDYQMQTREKTLLKQQEVIGGYQSEDYEAERHFVTAY